MPISSLKPGEKVVSTSTKTGKTQAGTIAAVLVHHDTNRYDLTVRARGRTAVIRTTSNHPFWDVTTGRSVKTGVLRYGTLLRIPAGGTATVLGGHAPRNQSGLDVGPHHPRQPRLLHRHHCRRYTRPQLYDSRVRTRCATSDAHCRRRT